MLKETIAKVFFGSLLVTFVSICAEESQDFSASRYHQITEPLITTLMERQPHWRMETIESYSDGIPKTVLFYTTAKDGKGKVAVKEMRFNKNAQPDSETDLLI